MAIGMPGFQELIILSLICAVIIAPVVAVIGVLIAIVVWKNKQIPVAPKVEGGESKERPDSS